MRKDGMIELESPLVQPAGLTPYTPIVKVQGRLCLDAFGRYWPLRAVVACLAAVVVACLTARLLATESGR